MDTFFPGVFILFPAVTPGFFVENLLEHIRTPSNQKIAALFNSEILVLSGISKA
jgi:hypothetical protein